jgi:site-specific recombinase XerD
MASQEIVIDHSQSEQLREAMQVLVLDGIASSHTRRAYGQALEEFLVWFDADPARRLDKATVQFYRAELGKKHLAASSINVRMSAIRRFAAEAGDNGLLPPQAAAAIGRVRGARRAGVRLGSWLSREEADQLLRLPNRATIKGLRDRALLGVLLGAGVRRSEASRLTFEHIQRREGRWVIADLLGKRGRLRTVPIPDWCKAMIDEWAGVATISDETV